MSADPSTALARLGRWFGVDDAWVRPSPPIGRSDVLLALAVEAFGLLSLELVRSVGVLRDLDAPWWVQWVAVSTGAVLLIGRRRWPLTVAAAAAMHMVLVGVTMPVVMGQLTMQVVYFVALMSGVAYARDRRWMLVVAGGILLTMFTWLALQFAIGNAVEDFLGDIGPRERTGLLAPIPAAVLLTLAINSVYFGGAIVVGQMQWRSARDRDRLRGQAATIAAQADGLRAQAVTEERLRIARELHDVVAHHVSVIGIQAAAARRVMDRDPEATREALAAIEGSSRGAVESMRGLLGTLREVDHPLAEDARAPQPTLADVSELAQAFGTAVRTVSVDLVESAPGALASVPAPLTHSLYRTAQEALTNVEKHSTATRVSVVVRVVTGPPGHVEVEVVDNGRPRHDAPSSGLGQLGIRERAASHQGIVDVGPRPTGGYRVRVRYPWTDGAAPAPAPAPAPEAGAAGSPAAPADPVPATTARGRS